MHLEMQSRTVKPNTPHPKLCEPAPSGIIPPKIVPIKNDCTRLTIREARALVGYMSYHRTSSAQVSEVRRSSASIAGWNKYYLDNVQKSDTVTEDTIFLTPLTSPDGE